MNWGSTAVKMISPLGLVAPTMNPSRTIARTSRASDGARGKSLGELLAVADAPHAKCHEIGGTDQLEDREDRLRPGEDRAKADHYDDELEQQARCVAEHRRERGAATQSDASATTNSTLGPGITISTYMVTKNGTRWLLGTTASNLAETAPYQLSVGH